LFALFCWIALGRAVQRFASDGAVPRAVAIAAASVILATGGVLFLEPFAAAVEMLRLGNGHLSYRGERIPWPHGRPAVFAARIRLCSAIAWIRSRRN